MLPLSPQLSIPLAEIQFQAIRAQGAGGQHVNKVSSAVHLRFDIRNSSLPDELKARLLQFKDQRISNDGIIVIKSQQFRSQEKNRSAALTRLQALIKDGIATQKRRRPTKPTKGSQRRRVDSKTKRGHTKTLRGKVDH